MKKTKLEKGITLIALIITIVVLLILAIVTIGSVRESGIIGHAQNAANDYTIAQEKEMIGLGYSEYKISKYANENPSLKVEGAEVTGSSISGWNIKFSSTGNEYELFPTGEIEKDEPIINTEEPDGWKYAWTCSEEGWNETRLENGVGLPTGSNYVAAKFYENENGKYKLIIEGNGAMQPLAAVDEEGNPTAFYAYQQELSTLFDDDSTNNYALIMEVEEVIVCDGVTDIGFGAFAYGTSITKAILAKTINTTIDVSTFMGAALSEITILGGSIGEGAFGAMTSLRKVTIGEGVTTIGKQAFDDCNNLETVIIENGVKKIGDGAFWSCALKSIVIPSSVTEIGKQAFEGTDLQNIYIESTELVVGNDAFYVIPSGATFYVRNDSVKQVIESVLPSGATISTNYNW